MVRIAPKEVKMEHTLLYICLTATATALAIALHTYSRLLDLKKDNLGLTNANLTLHRRLRRLGRQLKQREVDRLTGLIAPDSYLDKLNEQRNLLIRRRMGGNDENILLFFFDVDNLKLLNDTYGHQFGDKVLREFAQFLKGVLFRRDPPYDIVARTGRRGDEFMVGTLVRTDEIDSIINRARRASEIEVVTLAGERLVVNVSMGYEYVFDGKHVLEIKLVQASADSAMYAQKRTRALLSRFTLIES